MVKEGKQTNKQTKKKHASKQTSNICIALFSVSGLSVSVQFIFVWSHFLFPSLCLSVCLSVCLSPPSTSPPLCLCKAN